jgi:hypothetical protein
LPLSGQQLVQLAFGSTVACGVGAEGACVAAAVAPGDPDASKRAASPPQAAATTPPISASASQVPDRQPFRIVPNLNDGMPDFVRHPRSCSLGRLAMGQHWRDGRARRLN